MLDIGSKYIHRQPSLHSGFEFITLDLWADNKDPSILLADLKEQGKVINGHNILDKRRKPKARTLDGVLDYVHEKVGSTPGVNSWDVLNEVVGVWPDQWLLAVLSEVRKLQPDSLLFWNEYALKNRHYWNRLIRLAAIAKNLNILDGIGIQRHIDLRGKLPYSSMLRVVYGPQCHLKSWVNERRLSYEINRIHSLGLLCHISEVSITCFPTQLEGAQMFLNKLIEVAELNNVWRLTYWSSPVIKVMEDRK